MTTLSMRMYSGYIISLSRLTYGFRVFNLFQTGPLILTNVGEGHENLHSNPQLGQDACDAPIGGAKRVKQFKHLTSALRFSFRAIGFSFFKTGLNIPQSPGLPSFLFEPFAW